MKSYIRERKDAQHWLIVNGLMDTDYWRMNYRGEITFYPPKPNGMKIELTKED